MKNNTWLFFNSYIKAYNKLENTSKDKFFIAYYVN